MSQEKKTSRREGRRWELGSELLWGRIMGKEGPVDGPAGKGLGGGEICLTYFMNHILSIMWCKPPHVTPLDHEACPTLLPSLVEL